MQEQMNSESSRTGTGTAALLSYSRREQVAWYFYDWANSAFSTTVITVFLGPYLTAVTQAAADTTGYIYPLGIPVLADAFFPYIVSLSVVLQVFFLPVLGAIADYSHLKKRLFALFAYIGAFATMGMYFLAGDRYLLGGGLFLVANLSFGASIVFYNAYLPEIAAPDDRDKVSSQGWALGYLGGGILLAMNLVFVQFLAESWGIGVGDAVRISLASAGVWWAIFTLIPLRRLRSRRPMKSLPEGTTFLTIGFKQLFHTLRELPSYPHSLLFLIAYLLYNDGIQTVIAMSTQFGSVELGLETADLIQLILMVQFIAFFGALAFGYLARYIGSKRAIILSLVIWLAVTVYAYAILQSRLQFFIMGGVIAVVLGGSQALSRSLFSLMIPEVQEAEHFSLYEISERGTSWLGPLVFGLALQMTGSYRIAILSIAIFFALGFSLLFFVNVRRAIREAGNIAPEIL
ncbi:MAG: MFS transporter [Caldilineaceae bacterium]|nr:MFS transporter [Caldilineaceae bacterium]